MERDIFVITGGTGGLGYELMKLAQQAGYFVCNLSRNPEKMAKLDAEMGENYKGFVGDVSDEAYIEASMKEIAKLGKIKYLVNNAEKSCFKGPTEYTKNDIEGSFNGLRGMLYCTKHALLVTGEKDFTVVNVMSTAALKGKKQESLYCAVKWGERGYTEALKATFEGTSVKVVGVFPGGMNTGFWADNRNYISAEKSDTFMSPADVAAKIMEHLASSENPGDITISR